MKAFVVLEISKKGTIKRKENITNEEMIKKNKIYLIRYQARNKCLIIFDSVIVAQAAITKNFLN